MGSRRCRPARVGAEEGHREEDDVNIRRPWRVAAGIEPGRLYTLDEASALVLNPYSDRPVSLFTLRGWVRQGRLRTVGQAAGEEGGPLVRGSDLLAAVAAGHVGEGGRRKKP